MDATSITNATPVDSGRIRRGRVDEQVVPLFHEHAGKPSRARAAVWPISDAFWGRVEGLVALVGCTNIDFLVTALAVCLSRTYTVEDGVVIGLTWDREPAASVGGSASFLPLRVRVDDDAHFILNMQRIAAERRDPLQYAQWPIGRPAPEEDWAKPQLDALLCMPAGQGRFALEGVATLSFLASDTRVPLSLTLQARDEPHGCSASLLFESEGSFLSSDEVERLRRQFELLSQFVLTAEQCPVSRLPMMTEAERRQVLLHSTGDTRSYPRDLCIHEVFERQVQSTPLVVAVEQGGLRLSYRDLNESANRLARYLRHLGVRTEDRVAICMPHCLELLVAMVAVAKTGGAYVPLDPSNPPERRDRMLADSDARVLLTLDRSRSQTPRRTGLVVLSLDGAQRPWKRRACGNLPKATLGLRSHHLAYVIYTSGSTGEPKGVMVEHRSLANLVGWFIETLRTSPGERASCMAGVAFDAFGGEVWHGLCAGATLVMPPTESLGDPEKLVAWWSRQEFDVSFVVTALAEAAMSRALPTKRLRALLTGGDRLSRPPGEDVPFEVINVYGPTETTVAATMGRIRPQDEVIHIGRPVANTQIYLLDPHGQPVPVGVAGEIYIGGAGVARGYCNQPELTRERFLDDPFSGEPAARMYKTGDLGRWLPDGTIEFLGRNDQQVKIRGFRIELGEIESQLLQVPGVREAVVIAHEGSPDEKRLVAYLSGDGLSDARALRARLSQKLPYYMVPSAYVVLDRMPLTPNGKFDRKALPPPEDTAFGERVYEAPRGDVEGVLAQIWSELLRVERIGRQDHFFELGGHSLLAVQMSSRLRQRRNLEIAVSSLFAHPVLCDFAALVEQAPASSLPPLVPGNRPAVLPLSFAQQRLWFIARMGKEASAAYHLSVGFRMQGPLNEAALQAALDRILQRHEALRTRFDLIDGQPAQCIVQTGAFALLRHDLSGHGSGPAEVEHWCRVEASTPFDLVSGPLIRGRLLCLGEQEHVLLLTTHHIVFDGWSLGVLTNELGALYRAYAVQGVAARIDPLPAPPIQYPDYAVWQRHWFTGEMQERQLAFWREELAGIPALVSLPTDKPRPLVQDYRGQSLSVGLDQQLTSSLKALSQRHGATLYMTLLAAWGALVARLAGQDEVVIGTPVANRTRAEVEPLIGFFVNTLAVRLDLRDRPSVKQLLAQVCERVLQGQSHQDLPFEQVVEALNPRRTLAHSPVFQVLFSWQNASQAGLELQGLSLEELATAPVNAKFDLTLDLAEVHGRVVGTLSFATALFETSTMQRYLGYLEAMLRGMLRDDTQAVDAIGIVGEAERHQVLTSWNDTARDYPQDLCVHQLFEQHAARTPEALALVCGGLSLTYAELNQRANRVAGLLLRKGVGPDQLVGICLERRAELVVGLLGILKAGGAYVPLDPSYPPERLQYVLQDARPSLLLTQQSVRSRLPSTSTSLICLDSDWNQIARESANNPDARALGLRPDHLAYAIYTSGSTGQPKAVAIEHRNAVNLICWARSAMPPEFFARTLQSTSLNFDLAVYECFVPLSIGASLQVVENALEVLSSPMAVTLINTVPSTIRAILDSGHIPQTTRAVNLAGEALKKEVVDLIFQRSEVERVCNLYGPSETTTYSSWISMSRQQGFIATIGRPIANTRIYILDTHRQPVPIGVVGEIYIGGAGVARGYLNRPELTAERFIASPYLEGDRLYRTGDLARYLPDGNLEFLGRNDHQVKIRGFRIELGEIEAQLARQPGIREVAVLVREDNADERHLVAYLVWAPGYTIDPQTLRQALSQVLPDYMVPAVYVKLEALPLTPNGKLDRGALPAPEASSCAQRAYEAPQGEVEIALAQIWSDLLRLERVGRHDNFFELGGHSLLAVQLTERLQRKGLHADTSALFAHPTLIALAQAIEDTQRAGWRGVVVPANAIPAACETITPEMLPLVDLNQGQIAHIVAAVPGGAANVQDIYPLAPLQEGILFHHLLQTRGDPYLLSAILSFDSRARLDSFLQALQVVIDRHDVLRTAVLWEGLDAPVQVVWREARFEVQTLDLPECDTAARLAEHADPRHFRMDVRQAPLIRCFAAFEERSDRWLLQLVHHHLVLDHAALDVLLHEVGLILSGRTQELQVPVPFRNFVARARLGVSAQEHEAFFRQMLGDVDEPTAPFGLLERHGDGGNVQEAQMALPPPVSQRLRYRARVLGVSVASLFHWAWAQVLAKTTGREDVVFGTVLFGRLQGGADVDGAMGLFINTLPMRVRLGELSVQEGIRQTHATLSSLMRHEHASLALAQRCSALPAGTPLFTALLNYRHSTKAGDGAGTLEWAHGMDVVSTQERSSYPFDLSVDDLGDDFELSAQTAHPIEPQRVCAYMSNALEHLAEALEEAPLRPAWQIEVLDEVERRQALLAWNDAQPHAGVCSRPAACPHRAAYPHRAACPLPGACLHQLFERQVAATPQAIALEHEDRRLSYQALNERANRLARYLRELGVGPDERVAICLQRSMEMVVAILAVLKAGGAYVPLDPSYPRKRLDYMLQDSQSRVMLTQMGLEAGRALGTDVEVLELDGPQRPWETLAATDLAVADLGLTSNHLAYVMYTSGSTGEPKGVAVEHGPLCRRIEGLTERYGFQATDRILQFASMNFDVSVEEIQGALTQGATLVLATPEWLVSATQFWKLCATSRITVADLPTKFWQHVTGDCAVAVPDTVRTVIIGSEAVDAKAIEDWVALQSHRPRLFNAYGPTEALIAATVQEVRSRDDVHIGQPLVDTAVYPSACLVRSISAVPGLRAAT
jgi:amino acid adenylation domain-containing protein